MPDHYYTQTPTSAHKPGQVDFLWRGAKLVFETDSGVFSRTEIDKGTEILLNALPEELTGSLLDMGCGYGVIGVTVKKMFPDAEMLMVDVNPRAVELAVLNAQKNSVEAEVRVSDIFGNVTETLSDILTNPPIRAGKKVIYAMFEQAYDHLRPQGHLYVVIRKQQGALSAKAKIEEIFGNCEVINKEKGYYILKSTKTD